MKSKWFPNTVLPEVGRKIQFIINRYIVEVDTFMGVDEWLAENYYWSEVKYWRYVDENQSERSE